MDEIIKHIFSFDPHAPLLFTRVYFWVFLLIVYPLFACIRPSKLHLRNFFLMLVSWFFYYKTSGNFLLILITLTFINWGLALLPRKGKTIWLCLAVLCDLGFLFYYKYAYFGVDVFNSIFGTHFSIMNAIILPVGISFYTFQVISYSVDVYRGQVKALTNPFDFGFYVSFFPQLVAGPTR